MIRQLRSFRSKTDGATAIEFAFFAIPFFLLIMGIVEVGILYGAATVMNGAADHAARMIRTGQAQYSGDAETVFQNTLRDNLYGLVDFDDLHYQVIRLESDEDFRTATTDPSIFPDMIDASDPDNPLQLSASSFDAGGPNDRVIIRVFYDYQLLTPLAAPFLANRPGNRHLLITTVIIQNEPYSYDDEENS